MSSTPTTVLLAGDITTRSTTLQKWSRHLDCYWQFAASFHSIVGLARRVGLHSALFSASREGQPVVAGDRAWQAMPRPAVAADDGFAQCAWKHVGRPRRQRAAGKWSLGG
jgi:hypothetical protein